jgi:hypothetical protein
MLMKREDRSLLLEERERLFYHGGRLQDYITWMAVILALSTLLADPIEKQSNPTIPPLGRETSAV